MTKTKIYNEDAVEWAKNYSKGKFHALLCDAPYHLTSIVKRFGKKNSAPAQFGTDGVYSRASKGFMGTQWDGGDLAFRPETWEAFGNVLYPGAFGMAFSASRNWHRMAVAIEDAGFILHPTIFLWAYGQGFPKATRVKGQEDFDEHRYGLQALKPAVEPIIVFQKPFEGKPLDNIVSTGAGTLNIDSSRIPTQDEYVINRFDDGAKPFGNGKGHDYTSVKVGRPLRQKLGGFSNGIYGDGLNNSKAVGFTEQGRWPANLILEQDAAERLDEQSGHLQSGDNAVRTKEGRWFEHGKLGNAGDVQTTYGDSGGASRFFYCVQDKLDESDPVYYCAKVSPKERNAGLDNLPDKQFAQSGGAQSRLSQGEEEYKQDSIESNRISTRKNIHPTVKPIDLCRYLATLLLPPIEYAPRRIFVPFSGSGSEMIGAGLAGWEHVVGVEFDKENGYVDIAENRIQHWLGEKS